MPESPPEELEPVVFDAAVEGFRRSMGRRLTPKLVEEIKVIGVDLSKPAAIPLATWERMLRHVAIALFSELTESERYRALGHAFMQGYVETTIGRASLALGRVIGAKRTLMRMGRNFRSVTNYVEIEATEKGPTAIELKTWMIPLHLERHRERTDIFVSYRQGVIEETLKLLGRDGAVEISHCDRERLSATYLIHWKES